MPFTQIFLQSQRWNACVMLIFFAISRRFQPHLERRKAIVRLDKMDNDL